MDILDYTEHNITAAQFVQIINNVRKNNKNAWYAFVGWVENKKVALKGYNTWLQQFIVDSRYQPGPVDISVKQFLADLNRPFNTNELMR